MYFSPPFRGGQAAKVTGWLVFLGHLVLRTDLSNAKRSSLLDVLPPLQCFLQQAQMKLLVHQGRLPEEI